jgi:hypothetical protein
MKSSKQPVCSGWGGEHRSAKPLKILLCAVVSAVLITSNFSATNLPMTKFPLAKSSVTSANNDATANISKRYLRVNEYLFNGIQSVTAFAVIHSHELQEKSA